MVSLIISALMTACTNSTPSGAAAEQATLAASGPPGRPPGQQPLPGQQRPPAPLVAITLTPTGAVTANNLNTAVRVINQRATGLSLPSAGAKVSGQNVVLTGPKSDEAQLKAITASGVLRMRHVLLVRPPNGTRASTLGDANLVRPDVLELFSKLTCKPGEGGSAWKPQVGYSTSSDWDNPATQSVACGSDGSNYVLDVAKVLGEDVTGAAAMFADTNAQWQVNLSFNNTGTTAFGALTTQIYNAYATSASTNQNDAVLDEVGIVIDGEVVSAPEIQSPITGGNAQITGKFSDVTAKQLAAQLQGGSLPVDFQISNIANLAPSASG